MRAVVLHGQTDRNTFNMKDHQPVAEFDFSAEADTIDQALDLAYQYTNNIHDSWSRRGCHDRHTTCQLLQPLPIHEGRSYGHRSSTVGDRIAIYADGAEQPQTYEVSSFGFKQLQEETN